MKPTFSWPITYRFTGSNPGVEREFSALLTSCGFVQASGGCVWINIIFTPESELVTSHWKNQPPVEWRGLQIREKGEQTFFSFQAWNLELNFATLTVRCSGPDPEPNERLVFRELFLLSGLLLIMHRLGYFELHAAACAHEESGYLFLGTSGSGKTTAILSLIASGWKYLSDDAMVVSSDPEGTVWARPFRRSFSLNPDHFKRHPQLAAYATESVPSSEKKRLNPRQVWPEQYASVARPAFIIACSLADEETTRITPIRRAESLTHLIASAPWLMFDRATASAHLGTFRSLAASCWGFELKAGRDLLRNKQRIASLIAPEVLRQEWLLMKKDGTWA
jgi:hypothetical protein